MSRKIWLIGLLGMLVLAACSPATADEPSSGEAMAEEEMMDEEAMDEEMMDEEAMDEEEMMDEESMAEEEMMDEESMDEEMMAEEVTFTVRIENLSVVLAPGAWAVHTEAGPLFVAGEADRGDGLEALAEDGDPAGLNAALEGYMGVHAHGVFNTPVGAGEPGPATPGAAYEFEITAAPGEHLSFATMFVQSNDLFYAPDEGGVALFDDAGAPVSGDVTGQIMLWDAGTEVNQEPGVGPDQAPRQAGPNTGADENGVVQLVSDGFTYPDVTEAIQVTITPAS